MAELYIGTSGYDYPEWKSTFYPQNIKRADFLSYYAGQFNSLELNGTYYKMPTCEQMKNMINRTNGKIKFSIKAFNGLTHTADKSQYQSLSNEFKKALEPLQNDNLLLCVLLQFPESFHYEKDQRIYLDLLLKEFNDMPVVIEMRNAKWQKKQVFSELRQRQTGWCITDTPKQKPDYITTSEIAYIRFHGRNAQNWYKGDNITRYDYLYSDDELQSFISPIILLLQNTKIVQLFFNNHAKSQAVINAKKIEMLLKSCKDSSFHIELP
ncbi:MAG: DUF72 domain-containing protein [Treponema sp.]|nr:DUF72 domain-containing protein [Treponema sp.]